MRNLIIQRQKPKLNLKFRIELTKSIEQLLEEIENSYIFKKLKNEGIIYRKTKNFFYFPVNEGITPSNDNFDIYSFLNGREDVLLLIRKIGKEDFKKIFLNCEKFDSLKLKRDYNLSDEDIKKIIDFMDDFYINCENFRPTIYFKKRYPICEVVKEKDELKINFLIQKDYYRVDFERLNFLKKNISQEERKEIEDLIMKIGMLNKKFDTFQKILTYIINYQKEFFLDYEINKLKILTLRKLASIFNISPSSLSRLFKDKEIILPNGTKREIKFFLPSKGKMINELIREIYKPGLKGREIKEKLESRYGYNIPLRTVNYYIKKIKYGK